VILQVRNLHIPLPTGAAEFAVKGASLAMQPGEVLCLVGESGSGKSLTARAIMGLLGDAGLHVSEGEIIFKGRDLLEIPEREMRAVRGSAISMIFQEPMSALNPLMKVGEQVGEVFDIHRIRLSRAERRDRIDALLRAMKLPDPDHIANAYPFELSGGQRQRVLIATAFALNPLLLIADEPTTALDVTTQMQILRNLKEMQAEHGTAVLFITHDLSVVAEIADRVAVMRRGEVVEQGEASKVLKHPEHPYTQALLEAVPRLQPGRETTFVAARSKPILRVEGLQKVYFRRGSLLGQSRKEILALQDATFSLMEGETVAVVGESGSGKTTLGRCIVGTVAPSGGRVIFDGEETAKATATARKERRRLVQMVFQDPFASLNPRMRVGEIVMAGPLAHAIPKSVARQRAENLLGLVGLDIAAMKRYPHEFSGGQRQRIGIARALALEPKVLVADEPVSALDVTIQAQVLDLLLDLNKRFGLSMLFITHDLRVASEIADRIIVMQSGRIVEEGSATKVLLHPEHPYTRSLIDSIPGYRDKPHLNHESVQGAGTLRAS
jgi:peptide/nickel transport system ATP-binding protein